MTIADQEFIKLLKEENSKLKQTKYILTRNLKSKGNELIRFQSLILFYERLLKKYHIWDENMILKERGKEREEELLNRKYEGGEQK